MLWLRCSWKGLTANETTGTDHEMQAFGLESKACSRFGWGFLLRLGLSFSSEPLRGNSGSNFPEIQDSG